MTVMKNTCYRKKLNRLFILLPLSFSLMFSVSVHAEEPGKSVFDMPGRLVDIGTHRLHIHCKGSGTPSVIIDSGLGSFSLEWNTIQNNLERDTRICTYDRAGYGWSDPGPMPRTSRQISHELYQLLKRARIPGPYVLVGHSFGGYNIRYFASEHADLVAGIVLVDASHPEQFERLPLVRETSSEPKRKGSTYRIVRPIIHENYPEDYKRPAFILSRTPKSKFAFLSELDNMPASATELTEKATFPNVPLVVISRGKRVWPNTWLGDRLEITWKELQAELTYLTNMSVQIVATNSGHSVHLDQPELVSSVINKTVSATRKIEDNRVASLFVTDEDGHETQPFYPLNDYFEIPMFGAQLVKANYKDLGSSLRYLDTFR